jgi:hypothetical protein
MRDITRADFFIQALKDRDYEINRLVDKIEDELKQVLDDPEFNHRMEKKINITVSENDGKGFVPSSLWCIKKLYEEAGWSVYWEGKVEPEIIFKLTLPTTKK